MDLSIIIPARNEIFLEQTVDNVCKNIQGKTEVIVILDGYWPDPVLEDRANVHVVHHTKSIGQRAAINEGARMSTAKYVMKLDAHCAVDEGFDIKLMENCQKDWTVIPRMYNLHAFDWVCRKCGARRYQGPALCKQCGEKDDLEMDIIWQPRLSRKTDFARFDTDLRFQYWGAYGQRPSAKGDIADLMCFVGACFFMERERYWELDGLDEEHGSWGQMGVEISCKSWLSGGRQVVNKTTWFAHMFRTQDGFGFPYPQSGNAVEHAREYSRKLWIGNNWPKAIYNLEWLIDKFAPVPTWHNDQPAKKKESVTKGIIYYTDGRLDGSLILEACQSQLQKSANGIPVVASTLSSKPVIDFDTYDTLIHHGLQRGYLTMFKQILAALETINTDIVFFCEHDVLYHGSHFDFTPPKKDVYYYNENVWKVRMTDGHALHYLTQQTSGLCAYRPLLLEQYRRRVAICEENIENGLHVQKQGYTMRMGFEPGTHGRAERVDNHKAESWMSAFPNIDLRHESNLTPSRWSQDEFRNKRYCKGWTEADKVPGWGKTIDGGIIKILLGAAKCQSEQR